MERNYEKDIDYLKEELQKIKQLLGQKSDPPVSDEAQNQQKTVGHVQKMRGMHADPHIMAIMDRLENTCGEHGQTGAITYLGVFASGDRQSSWIRNDINTDRLLGLIADGTAEKVLSCIGNNERLNILLAILKKPRTVAELIEECHLSSSGQAYHHMKPLLAADLIKEDNMNYAKGTYIIQPHKVQGIIMLLAGICDMVDETYSQGSWESEEE